ncbi:hypothetical protein B0H12DRAFT_1241691 [Mycena haematopus]|nr:hypothetical protein B0H12DRAFT_1241691 [Mycena haematopus]
MTVAVYDGLNAREVRKYVSRTIMTTHCPPELDGGYIKIFAFTTPKRVATFWNNDVRRILYAIFHDDFVSAHKLLQERSKSALWTFYFQRFLRAGFRDAASYISSALGGQWVSSEECTIWIRASTGKICLELTPGYQILSPPYFIERGVYQHDEIFDDSVKLEVADLIASISFPQYYSAFCEDPPTATLSELPASVSLGSILDLGLLATDSDTVIARLPVGPTEENPIGLGLNFRTMLLLTINGHGNIHSGSVAETYYYNADLEQEGLHSWLAQANHIFNKLNINDRCEKSAVVVRITIKVTLEGSIAGLPLGFLFLYCPSPLHSTPAKVRNSIAYWALDRTGQQRLSAEDALELGFPPVKAEIEVHVKSWNTATYLILRQFHEGKGFDPDGEEIARHLGLAPVSLTAPPSSSVTPFTIAVQLPESDKTLPKESEDREMQAEGSEAEKASGMFPRRQAAVLSLQCGFIVSVSLAVASLWYFWD